MKHEELNLKKIKNIEKRNRNKYKIIVIKLPFIMYVIYQ
jgi:hypothetical protein